MSLTRPRWMHASQVGGDWNTPIGGEQARIERSCPPMEYISIGLLREYLRLDLCAPREPSNCADSYDLENVLDDFVLMTFLVGNDFLPHLPGVDIAEGSLDALMLLYRHMLPGWLAAAPGTTEGAADGNGGGGYLTHHGKINWHRLEEFLVVVGRLEPVVMRARGDPSVTCTHPRLSA